jgi:hypothetical protein
MAGVVGAAAEATVVEAAVEGAATAAAEAATTAALAEDPTGEVRGEAAEGTTIQGEGALGVVAMTTCRLRADGAAPLPRMLEKPSRRVGRWP